MKTIYLAGGCLWSVQYFMNTIPGVIKTEAGRANGSTDTLGQPVIADPVDNSEVDRLRLLPHCRADLFKGNLKHFSRGAAVDIFILAESVEQDGVARKVGQHPQLDLRIIGGEENPAAAGRDESQADAPPLLQAYGDVLQIGIAAA